MNYISAWKRKRRVDKVGTPMTRGSGGPSRRRPWSILSQGSHCFMLLPALQILQQVPWDPLVPLLALPGPWIHPGRERESPGFCLGERAGQGHGDGWRQLVRLVARSPPSPGLGDGAAGLCFVRVASCCGPSWSGLRGAGGSVMVTSLFKSKFKGSRTTASSWC